MRKKITIDLEKFFKHNGGVNLDWLYELGYLDNDEHFYGLDIKFNPRFVEMEAEVRKEKKK